MHPKDQCILRPVPYGRRTEVSRNRSSASSDWSTTCPPGGRPAPAPKRAAASGPPFGRPPAAALATADGRSGKRELRSPSPAAYSIALTPPRAAADARPQRRRIAAGISTRAIHGRLCQDSYEDVPNVIAAGNDGRARAAERLDDGLPPGVQLWIEEFISVTASAMDNARNDAIIALLDQRRVPCLEVHSGTQFVERSGLAVRERVASRRRNPLDPREQPDVLAIRAETQQIRDVEVCIARQSSF